MKVTYNRWLILAASALGTLCCGMIYAWSVFPVPLNALWGWGLPELSVVFAVALATGPFALVSSVKLQQRMGFRFCVGLSGALVSLGMFLSGFATSVAMLIVTVGFIYGVGMALYSATALANASKFFPERKGLTAGVVLGAIGLGSTIWAQVATRLIAVPGIGVMNTFKILGGIAAVLTALCVAGIRNAPDGYRPEGSRAAAEAVPIDGVDSKTMLKTPSFYILVALIIAGSHTGLTMLSSISMIGQTMYGMSAQLGASFIGIISICNSIGRLTGGILYDRLSFKKSFIIIYTITFAALIGITLSRATMLFAAAAIVIGYAYGFTMVVLPSVATDLYGTKHFVSNYGFLFMAFSVTSLVSPRLAAALTERSNGDYTSTFLVAAGACVVGMLLLLTLHKKLVKLQPD